MNECDQKKVVTLIFEEFCMFLYDKGFYSDFISKPVKLCVVKTKLWVNVKGTIIKVQNCESGQVPWHWTTKGNNIYIKSIQWSSG